MLVTLGLNALRWRLILKAMGKDTSVAITMGIVLQGHFLNQLLPTSFGGDVWRVWGIRRAGLDWTNAIGSVIFDRAIGFVALLVLIWIGLPLLLLRVGRIELSIVAASALPAAVLTLWVLRAIGAHHVLERLPVVGNLFTRLYEVIRLASGFRLAAVQALLISILVHVAALACTSILANALGEALTLVDAMLIVPAVLFISALPISIAGWGLREASLAGGFALLALAPEVAVGASILLGLLNIVAGLPGAVQFVLYRRSPDRSAGSAPGGNSLTARRP